ncbi:MAG: DUF4157 domain-containing protein [Candidatus Methanoperedens sp.]|nr:DUF4157 domain-containing protein [Candidatus Methanoperedens sp.]
MNDRISITDRKHETKSQNLVPEIRRKTESFQSMNSPVDRILYLQRTIGNQAVGKLIKSGALQAKFKIGQPGDVYEQEADRVAEQVMRMPDVSKAKDTRVQRKCPKCLKGLSGLLGKDIKDEKLQAKEIQPETPEVTSNMDSNINALRSGGQPLPESVSAFFEPRFGHDFSQVRVHSGRAAEQSARDVNANAYTVEHNIVFGAGQFVPGTQEGRRLIAHELTHVVQQTGSDGIRVGQINEKHGLYAISKNHLGKIRRKVNYVRPDIVYTDPVTTVLDNPHLALTTPVINGQPLPPPVIHNKVPDYRDAANIIFPLFGQLYIDNISGKSMCKVKEPEVNCSSQISIIQKPVSNVWQGSTPGTRFKTHSAACENVSNVTVYIKGKSGDNAITVYNKVLANEMEHDADFNKCAKKHFEPYIIFLNKYNKQVSGDKKTEDKECMDDFTAYVGNKDALMIQAFISELTRLVSSRDKRGGAHFFSPDIIVDGKDCFTIVIKI